ncbi:gonadotropin-releasing hormone receptor-like [Limulus polyphemus]|uniref:Gonadotropin-releasing hormone receptor-like n=1 Tax=Limulus polyphemus TaxID=6850 RepID=A0ABM1S4I9_LIMPO|nr:gonadotropin-releasing hormone receptor-like [Limulus polyphemus]
MSGRLYWLMTKSKLAQLPVVKKSKGSWVENICFWATPCNVCSKEKMNVVATVEVSWVKREESEELLLHNYENTSTVISHESGALRDIRVFLLWVFVLLGLLGNSLMLNWLWTHRKQKTRMVRLFGNLALADVLVTLCGTLPLLVLEYLGPSWPAGEILCKLFHFLLGFSCCASNYMVVPIAFDRCRAVKRPLALRTKVSRLTAFSWITSLIMNVPNFIFYRVVDEDKRTVCRNIVFEWPIIYIRIFLTGLLVCVYVIPLIAIIICNILVCRQIRKSFAVYRYDNEKCHGNVSKVSSLGLCFRQFRTSTFHGAEIRAVKLTVAIILIFLLCEAPFCVLQLIRVYGHLQDSSGETYSILPVFAISNSSIMPFVFLVLYAKFPFFTSSSQSSRKENSHRVFIRDYI